MIKDINKGTPEIVLTVFSNLNLPEEINLYDFFQHTILLQLELLLFEEHWQRFCYKTNILASQNACLISKSKISRPLQERMKTMQNNK